MHTPGPWRVAPASEYVEAALHVDAGPRGFVCLAGYRGDSAAEANARLISAAPDMLDALQALVAKLDDQLGHKGKFPDTNSPLGKARAAIDKAVGHG